MSVSLSYTATGEGRPLLLMMGLGADRSAWDRHLRRWSREFRCLAVDNRGAGASPAPAGPYSTAEMADDYAALLDREGVEQADIVGISMGGAIAQEFALRHPDRVRRIVMVATWSHSTPYLDAVLDVLAAVRRGLDTAAYVTALQTVIWTPEAFVRDAEALAGDRRGPVVVGLDAFDAQVAACRTHDVRERLAAIEAPVLVTAGAADRFVPADLSRELAGALRRADYEEFATGHVHHFEELDRFNDLVVRWLG